MASAGSGEPVDAVLTVRALEKLAELVASKRSRPDGPGRADEKRAVGIWTHGDVGNRLVDRALDADTAAGRALAAGSWWLPGLSVWALCRKR